VDECHAAGYHAIEFMQVHTQLDPSTGEPIEGTGHLAPVVLPDKCVGCGICQTRCYGINVAEKHLLKTSAIIIEAGEGREDRLMTGSYVSLREEEARQRAASEEK
jgi:NAD-dependent dihydropyrimidine dehydrogenase PreA subunit